MSSGFPYRISTLLYAFGSDDRVLLLERTREPNRGLWSPPGGKLQTETGESPWACAIREAREELGLSLVASDIALTGIVSEHGYRGSAHWLMFLFEILPRLRSAPPAINEGRFAFFEAPEISTLPVPETDRDQIWPLFWRHRGGFFAAHCRCDAEGAQAWTLEASRCAEPSPTSKGGG